MLSLAFLLLQFYHETILPLFLRKCWQFCPIGRDGHMTILGDLLFYNNNSCYNIEWVWLYYTIEVAFIYRYTMNITWNAKEMSCLYNPGWKWPLTSSSISRKPSIARICRNSGFLSHMIQQLIWYACSGFEFFTQDVFVPREILV